MFFLLRVIFQALACVALFRVFRNHILQSAVARWEEGVLANKQSEGAARMLNWLQLKVVVAAM